MKVSSRRAAEELPQTVKKHIDTVGEAHGAGHLIPAAVINGAGSAGRYVHESL